MKLPTVPPKIKDFSNKIADYINALNPREKTMVIGLAVAVFLTIYYFVMSWAVSSVFMTTGPKLSEVSRQLSEIKSDAKNKPAIEKKWQDARDRFKKVEGSFIAPNGMPALLENLSKLAQESGVRILSLKPADPAAREGDYQRIPIKITGTAGAHELGAFLSQLEQNSTFFRVADIRITSNETEAKRHAIELSIETYRKVR
jgi:Tfp pilus assembly protein PilO